MWGSPKLYQELCRPFGSKPVHLFHGSKSWEAPRQLTLGGNSGQGLAQPEQLWALRHFTATSPLGSREGCRWSTEQQFHPAHIMKPQVKTRKHQSSVSVPGQQHSAQCHILMSPRVCIWNSEFTLIPMYSAFLSSVSFNKLLRLRVVWEKPFKCMWHQRSWANLGLYRRTVSILSWFWSTPK